LGKGDYFMKDKKNFGDYQTPPDLSDHICRFLAKNGISPTHIIEPTCGKGNFIVSALKTFNNLKFLYGIDFQQKYQSEFENNIHNETKGIKSPPTIEFHLDNIFTHTFSETFLQSLKEKNSQLLIIGNPPWVTNSDLSKNDLDNIPKKSNYKKFKGIDSITGKSNFDIAEFIITSLIKRFQELITTPDYTHVHISIAFLCKNIVYRNILKLQNKADLALPLSNMQAYQLDTKKWFNISATASLFLATLGVISEKTCQFQHYPELIGDDSIKETITLGWYQEKFLSNMDQFKKFQSYYGIFPFEWRQGVKHDASKVMIIKNSKNQLDEVVEVEKEFLYPLLKSSELKRKIAGDYNKELIVTQHKVGEATDHIRDDAPKLWKYLQTHREYFDRRKSSIYNKKPDFSIFGIGEYSFKPYKIAVAGFYKKLNFCLILPQNNKPVMLDDTSYFIYFDELKEAFIIWAVLTLKLKKIESILTSITFIESKRPWTKDHLMKINFPKLVQEVEFEEIRTLFQQIKEKIPKIPLKRQDFEKLKLKFN
jgi:hypothetical protein